MARSAGSLIQWLDKFASAEFVRFVFFGGVNTVLTYVLYALLLLVTPYTAAFTIQYAAGILLSYFLNSVFVFKQPMELKKALQFPLVYVVQYLLGMVLMYALVDFLRIHELVAPALVILLSLPVTFVMSRFVIKRTPSETASTSPVGSDALDMVYFSSIDWNATWQRPQQIASRLAHHGKILYISPFGLRAPRLRDAWRIARRAAFLWTRASRQTQPSKVSVYTPLVYLPFPDSAWATRVNAWLLRRAIDRWMARYGITRPVFWTSTPSAAVLQIVNEYQPRLLVYDCLDNFAFFHKNKNRIIDSERQLAAKARLVFATAGELFDRMRALNPHTYRIPNAAEFEHFYRAPGSEPVPPEEMAAIGKPILGYIGEIAPWFDFDLVYDLAKQNPAWSIVLIGHVHDASANRLAGLPNVHLLGRKDYAELPGYLHSFDVCLLPFQITALTSAVNPVKLYEYLAAGKPVVSTALKEAMCYDDVVSIADRAGFSAAIQAALQTAKDPRQMALRVDVARRNTWEGRVEEILKILKNSGTVALEPSGD